MAETSDFSLDESESGENSPNLCSSPEKDSPLSCVDRGTCVQVNGIPDLPEFTPMAPSRFVWGDLDSETFTVRLNRAYSTVVHSRQNIFAIPSGNAGTTFVNELSRPFHAYAVGSTLESIALKAALTMCALLLQKPSRSSKSKDHVACLVRRMASWKAGDIDDLLEEGSTIQHRLTLPKLKQSNEDEKS